MSDEARDVVPRGFWGSESAGGILVFQPGYLTTQIYADTLRIGGQHVQFDATTNGVIAAYTRRFLGGTLPSRDELVGVTGLECRVVIDASSIDVRFFDSQGTELGFLGGASNSAPLYEGHGGCSFWISFDRRR